MIDFEPKLPDCKISKYTENGIDSIVYNCGWEEGLSQYPDKYFDLSICDPPYGINVNMNAGKKKGEKDRYDNKSWDINIPNKSYFNELERVSKDVVLWGCNYFNGFLWACGRISWFKNNGANNDFSDCELAMNTFNNRVTNVSIQWSGFIKPKSEKSESRIHPTQKPIQLYDWIYKNYSKQGMKILDTHLGSGSNRIAANKAGLDFVGFEIDEDYYEAQEKRYKNFISQLKLFQ